MLYPSFATWVFLLQCFKFVNNNIYSFSGLKMQKINDMFLLWQNFKLSVKYSISLIYGLLINFPLTLIDPHNSIDMEASDNDEESHNYKTSAKNQVCEFNFCPKHYFSFYVFILLCNIGNENYIVSCWVYFQQ